MCPTLTQTPILTLSLTTRSYSQTRQGRTDEALRGLTQNFGNLNPEGPRFRVVRFAQSRPQCGRAAAEARGLLPLRIPQWKGNWRRHPETRSLVPRHPSPARPPRALGPGTDPPQPPSPPPETAAEGRGAARAGPAGAGGSASPRPGPAQQVRPGPTSRERSGRLTPTMFLSDLDAATHVSSASNDPASWPPPPRPPPSPPSSPPPSRRAPAFTHTAVAAHALCALASLSNGSTVGR